MSFGALQWEDVDVERGTVHVHRGLDREGRGKATKTGVARRIPIEPELLPLLRAMHAEGDGGARVITLPMIGTSPALSAGCSKRRGSPGPISTRAI